MKYVTQSDIPFSEAFYMSDRFVILNMWKDGIWYVDKEHPDWEKIKETALNIATTFGDTETVEMLSSL